MNDLLLAALDPAQVKPGWLGLVVVLAIAVAIVILWRSMNRQLRKVDFDDGGDKRGDTETQRTDEADTSS